MRRLGFKGGELKVCFTVAQSLCHREPSVQNEQKGMGEEAN